MDTRSHAPQPLRRAGELGQPLGGVLRRIGAELAGAEVRLPLLQPVGARVAIHQRVQALWFLSTTLADAGECSLPELSGTGSANAVEHQPDDALCGGLQRTVHAGRPGHSKPDADDVRA